MSVEQNRGKAETSEQAVTCLLTMPEQLAHAGFIARFVKDLQLLLATGPLRFCRNQLEEDGQGESHCVNRKK